MVEFKVSYFADGEVKHHLTHARSEGGAIESTKEALNTEEDEASVWFRTKMILVEPNSLEDKLHYFWSKRFPEIPVPNLSNWELKRILGLEREWGVSYNEYKRLLKTNKDIPSKKMTLPIWCIKFETRMKVREFYLCRLFLYALNKREAIERAISALWDEIWRIHSVFPVNCVEEDVVNKERWVVKYSSVRGGEVSHYHTTAFSAQEAVEELKEILDYRGGDEYNVLLTEKENEAISSKFDWEVLHFDDEKISSHNVYALCEEEAIEKVKVTLGDELRATKMIMAQGSTPMERLRIVWDKRFHDKPFPSNLSFEEIREKIWPWSEEA